MQAGEKPRKEGGLICVKCYRESSDTGSESMNLARGRLLLAWSDQLRRNSGGGSQIEASLGLIGHK